MAYLDDVQNLAVDDSGLAEQLRSIRSLELLIEWLPTQRISLAELELINQDEYCHDLVVRDGPHGRWLVFGLT